MVSIFCVRLPAAFCIWYQKVVLQGVPGMIIRYQFLSLQYIKKHRDKTQLFKICFLDRDKTQLLIDYLYHIVSFFLIDVLFPKVCVKIMRKVPFYGFM